MQPETWCASFVDIAMAVDVERARLWMIDINPVRDVCMDLDSLWGKHKDHPVVDMLNTKPSQILSGLEVLGELLTRK